MGKGSNLGFVLLLDGIFLVSLCKSVEMRAHTVGNRKHEKITISVE